MLKSIAAWIEDTNENSNLSNADFSGASLVRVDFYKARMKNTKLLGADMTGAANYKDKIKKWQKLEMIDYELDSRGGKEDTEFKVASKKRKILGGQN